MELERAPGSRFHFEGLLGRRLIANEQEWLLRAPGDNPGLLGMFRVRDEPPPPDLVPWAGEFVGKFLISAIQALRMSDNLQLREQTEQIVADLIATQAEDGYLGPFPKNIRLKANWDLWGHYHCMLALLMWHEETGDEAALNAVRRVADLICRTFLDGDLRVRDAGSEEMNMAVIHSLGVLYRRVPEPRYLQMMREIEKDWESAGDYLRTGVAGIPFYQTPRPRWESLHDLQGLLELYHITGEANYRLAFENHWRSIRRWDRHNTGAFSTEEGATGNAYSPGAIETCCTVAWMALTLDYLALAGDPEAADELELSTWNAVAGAQNPSGRWWTYDTPMAGVRIPSYEAIAFQVRPGTPELNCCSVNGPRGLGMLSEWAVMTSEKGLAVNFYGPVSIQCRLRDGTPISLRQETDYPLSGYVKIVVGLEKPIRFPLLLRIPAWSQNTTLKVSSKGKTEAQEAAAGRYAVLDREWNLGDTVTLNFDMRLRAVEGEKEAAGHVSLYRGPLLLACDTRLNPQAESAPPILSLSRLEDGKVVPSEAPPNSQDASEALWLLLDLPAADGRILHLCDYAGAGTTGTRYFSWLPI